MDADIEGGTERLSRKIRDTSRARSAHTPYELGREVRPAVRRQATAEDGIGGLAAVDLRQEGLAFLLGQPRAFGYEAILLPPRAIEDGVADPGVAADAYGPVVETVCLDQGGERAASEAPRGVDGDRPATQLLHHARHVDAAATRVEPFLDRPHLPDRRDLLRLAPVVEGRVQGEGRDVVHGIPRSA